MTISDQERADLRQEFERFRQEREPAQRDALVARHLGLAIHLARRFDHRGVPLDDLVQVASLALVQAVDRYDPDHGNEFSSFATPTIVGELKRHFRDKSWAVRVPRRIQELHGQINALAGTLTQELGRSPTITELAAAARSSPEEVLEALEAAQAYRSVSLDAATSDDGSGPGLTSELAEETDLEFEVGDRLEVERLLATLEPRERLMVELRFYEEMTQAEIAERLDISQMHVSRLLARCLARFREVLTDDAARDR